MHTGYRTVLHSGSLIYTALVTLVPDMGIGVYISFNIPRGIERRLIHAYAMDIVLGETPWLNVELACNISNGLQSMADYAPLDMSTPDDDILPGLLTVPSVDHRDATPKRANRPLTEYVGTYGNFGYGNVTISLNSGGAEQILELSYGKIGRFNLIASGETDEFLSVGVGLSSIFNLGVMKFHSSDNQTIDELRTVFERLDPPTFKRDLKMSDAPPPPNNNC